MAADEIKQTIVIEASLTKIQADLKTLEGNFAASFGKIGNIGKEVLGAFGVGLSAAALVGSVKSVIDLGDKLSDLSDITGLSIATLGGLRVAAEQNNSSIDDLAGVILKAQVNLGKATEGGEGAAHALEKLGLSVKAMQNASPEAFFETVAQKLAGLTNQNDRAAVAAEIFGKAGAKANAAILQWVNEGMTKLDTSTAEAYKRLGDLKDSIVVLTAKLLDLGAAAALGLDRLFNISPAQKLQTELKNTADELDKIDRKLTNNKGASPITFGVFSSDAEREKRRAAEAVALQTQRAPLAARMTDLIDKEIRGNQPKPTAAFKGIAQAKPTSSAQDTGVLDFFAGLQKQAQGLDVQLVGLRDGEAVAKALALDFQLIDFNKKRAEEGKPLASTEQFAKLKAAVLTADAALVKFKADKDLVEIDQKLFTGAIDTSTATGKQQKMVADVTFEFISMAKKIEEVGRAAQLTQSEIADRIGLAWQGSVTKINEATAAAKKSLDELRQNMAIEAMPTDTIQGAKQKRVAVAEAEFKTKEKTIRDLGVASNASPEQIAADVAALRRETDSKTDSSQVFKDLRRSMDETAAEAQMLGSAINVPAQNVSDLTNALKQLAHDGFDPLSPRVEQLKSQLADAQWMDRLSSGFDKLSDALVNFDGDWKKLGMSVKGVIDDMVKDFLKMQLKQAFNGAMGGMFGGGGAAQPGNDLAGLVSASAGGGGSNIFSSIGSGISSAFGGIKSLFGFHEGGLITPGGEHASFRRAIMMHSGGEVPVLAQAGEFMLNRMASARIGSPSLNFMNRTGSLPDGSYRTGGNNKTNIVVNVTNPNFADRKSQGQVLARLGSSVRNANRNL